MKFFKDIFSPAQAKRLANGLEDDLLAAVSAYRSATMAAIDDIRSQIKAIADKAEARITTLEKEIETLKAPVPVDPNALTASDVAAVQADLTALSNTLDPAPAA